MADLDDLGYKSITEMSVDESLELIRQIRLQRRVAATKPKKKSSKKEAPEVNANQAAELLKILTGGE
jgi:hypothetical protein